MTKGAAVAGVLDRLGTDFSVAIGIGNNGNDVEMLQVGGVAMGNASDEIKRHADQGPTSVLDDGIWNTLQRYGLFA